MRVEMKSIERYMVEALSEAYKARPLAVFVVLNTI
jgi:hypothetical protein